jgi:threonine efflux protein
MAAESDYFNLGVAASIMILGLVTLGPTKARLMQFAMCGGRPAARWFAIGIAMASTLWSTAAVLGVATVIPRSPTAWVLMVAFASVYLLKLAAAEVFRPAMAWSDDTAASAVHPVFMIRAGLLVHLTNPKAALGWLALATLAVRPEAPPWVGLTMVAGAAAISLAGHLAYAQLFSLSTVRPILLQYQRPIGVALALIYVWAGISLLSDLVVQFGYAGTV